MLMKSPRLIWIMIALAVLGAMLGYYISTVSPWRFVSEDVSEAVASAEKGIAPADSGVSEFLDETLSPQKIVYPSGAISGELVVQFNNQDDYLAYLSALAAAGIAPLGQIDGLLAVRIPEQALGIANLDRYEARADYSYQVERPLPPVQLDPAALARLSAFGLSARAIAAGALAGTGEGVMVAVLDSGIEAHPQFDDVRVLKLDLSGEGVSGIGAGHGTSVASIIAGSEGIAPDAKLYVVRVLDNEGLGNSYQVAQGIIQAVDKGAKIINMSLGVYQDTALLRQAVQYASERGVLMVAAVGNDAYNRMPYPAAYAEVLAVTAVDASGQYALFPNQSIDIDFAAPGVGVLTALEDEGTVLFSGTSAAAPFVSAALASLMSGDEALPAQQAVELLSRYLNDQGAPGVDPVYGAGLLDWDRLRERASPGILDLALADIYLQSDAPPGTTMPIEVTVQNRGTSWLSDAELEVFVGEAEPLSFILGSLSPGQITTRQVYAQVPVRGSEQMLRLAARVSPANISQDVRPENNTKAVAFRPAE